MVNVSDTTPTGNSGPKSWVNSLNLQNKVVQHYENGTNPQRSCKILDKYLDVLPTGANANDVP